MTALLEVLEGGLFTTVQDRGRFGHLSLGVPEAGARDPIALALAQALVGNQGSEAALEVVFLGPKLLNKGDEACLVALVGGLGSLKIDDEAIPNGQSAIFGPGQTLECLACTDGLTAILAFSGGIDVPQVLGSRSTYTRGPFGGYEGRPLKQGDQLPTGIGNPAARPLALLEPYDALRQSVRVMKGPQADHFESPACAALFDATFEITQDADRMGVRLEGPQIEPHQANIVSDAMTAGAIQIPGVGKPIILLNDRGTIGGYPKIATVISADLPVLAALRPGDSLKFVEVDYSQARDAAIKQQDWLNRCLSSLVPIETKVLAKTSDLLSINLISGVISGSD